MFVNNLYDFQGSLDPDRYFEKILLFCLMFCLKDSR